MHLNDTFRGSKVLVTGGLGFIGSNLAHSLLDLGAEVSLVDALVPGSGGNPYNIEAIKDAVEVCIADIRDESAMARQVEGKDYIFNLAAQVSHVGSMEDPFQDMDINCRGHLVLLEACRKHNGRVKVVFTGTRSQYGRIVYTPVDEEHPLNPTDTNGVTKQAAEQYHLLYHRAYGIRAVSLRLTNTYGPRHQMKHSKQGFIGWFVRQALDGECIRVFGDGSQIRDFNYVDDVVSALLLAAVDDRADGQVFNLGGQHATTLEMARLVIKLAGRGDCKLIPYPEEDKRVEIGDYVADTGKIRGALGWAPTVSLEDGLRMMVEFYERNKSEYW